MIIVYSKCVHVLALNKGNINDVPVNKIQFDAVIDSNEVWFGLVW